MLCELMVSSEWKLHCTIAQFTAVTFVPRHPYLLPNGHDYIVVFRTRCQEDDVCCSVVSGFRSQTEQIRLLYRGNVHRQVVSVLYCIVSLPKKKGPHLYGIK